jgi:hypothetical protein
LYRKLITIGKVSDVELREALHTNDLKEVILYRGSQLPSWLMADDLDWLRSQNGFAANSVTDFAQIIESIQDLPGLRPLNEIQCREKQHAAMFYCQPRNGYLPDVDEDNWLDLGFCTARSQEQYRSIGTLYRMLIDVCAFEEFWKAMQDATMIELFRRHGLSSQVGSLHNFLALMQIVGKWHQSVWELMRFILTNDREPIRTVHVDYGVQNCQSPHDRSSLRTVYHRYFSLEHDELELHQACIEGTLSAFLRSKLGELPLDSGVFSNPYPLEGCNHMGLVATKVVICTESSYALVRDSLRAEGNDSVLWTIPDICDLDMKSAMQDRAANLAGHLTTRRSQFGNHTIVSLSCD